MERCRSFFEEFARVFGDKERRSEERTHSRLKEWTERDKASGIVELKAFAVDLLQDTEAVVGAMALLYS